jgi:adenylate cyclase
VLWYADLRGFTRISDVTSGAQIVEMLNEIFEMLTASLRTRGGHVLKFIGDAMLATISFEEAEERVACNRGLEAAMESWEKVESRNLQRRADRLPFARVDIALHVGEVLYGNVGAADRLNFTVIGPAVNEVVRMEKLCDMLGRHLLFSSRFAEAAGRCDGRQEFLEQFKLRGVGDAQRDLRAAASAHRDLSSSRLDSTGRRGSMTVAASRACRPREQETFRRRWLGDR